MGWRALSTSLPHRRPASGSEITERIVAYPQPTERERPSQSNGSRQGAAMDYEGFFSKRLDALRAEGRYRIFADLERRCGRFRAPLITASAPRSRCGVRTTISA